VRQPRQREVHSAAHLDLKHLPRPVPLHRARSTTRTSKSCGERKSVKLTWGAIRALHTFPFSVDKAKETREKLRAKLERIPLKRFSGSR
jgi:hypothetical protein